MIRIIIFTVIVLLTGWARTTVAEPYVLSAPPRESADRGRQVYGPIAKYLSLTTGKPFVYRHPGNWLAYMKDMQSGAFDLVFDEPHFVGWRMEHLDHTPLARLPGSLDFVVIARDDDAHIIRLSDLAGYWVCGPPPPSLATLTLRAQFSNPTRQPQVRSSIGIDQIYGSVRERRCRGGVLPAADYSRMKTKENPPRTRILYKSRALPGQAFSAAPTVPTALQREVRNALLSADATSATSRLRNRFADGGALIPAAPADYDGLSQLLSAAFGFGF